MGSVHYAKPFALKVIPLSDTWAKRQHVLVCQEASQLHPVAQSLLNFLMKQERN
jgi:hypothetical protein